jgi:sterol desaturase/sphingolipid hydroxylase (fatty acid hydroxylase superfamily)
MFELTEPQIRLGIFIGLFFVLAMTELFVPRRELEHVKAKRWLTNWIIVIIDSFVLRLIFTGAAVGIALWAETNDYGLFNVLNIPTAVAVVISFIVLDFAVWFSHWASHKVPLLWAIHRMHHSDVDIDVSTAIRFHPIEIVLSMVWKMLIVVILGAPAIAVLVFEIVLNGTAMFNHSNIKLPLGVDRILRLFLVTPDMHRVHHSIIHNETDSNYGFNLAIWDRLFGTYIDQPEAGHKAMKIGISEWQDKRPTQLFWSLKVPFIKQK